MMACAFVESSDGARACAAAGSESADATNAIRRIGCSLPLSSGTDRDSCRLTDCVRPEGVGRESLAFVRSLDCGTLHHSLRKRYPPRISGNIEANPFRPTHEGQRICICGTEPAGRQPLV